MSRTSPSAAPSWRILPLYTARPTALAQLAAVLLGNVVLIASSWVEVPMVPVPMTMQTLAVTLLGALYGWRLAGATLGAWLIEASLGAPVLAGGHGGLPYMAGPTGGYLVAFLLTAVVIGWLAERGVLARGLAVSLAVMVVANLFILGLGALWLSHLVGTNAAIAHGVVPFVLGGLVKAALATGLVEVLGKGRSTRVRKR